MNVKRLSVLILLLTLACSMVTYHIAHDRVMGIWISSIILSSLVIKKDIEDS